MKDLPMAVQLVVGGPGTCTTFSEAKCSAHLIPDRALSPYRELLYSYLPKLETWPCASLLCLIGNRSTRNLAEDCRQSRVWFGVMETHFSSWLTHFYLAM